MDSCADEEVLYVELLADVVPGRGLPLADSVDDGRQDGVREVLTLALRFPYLDYLESVGGLAGDVDK